MLGQHSRVCKVLPSTVTILMFDIAASLKFSEADANPVYVQAAVACSKGMALCLLFLCS